MSFVEIPGNPVPSKAVAGMLTARDGVRLRYARFPATSPNRGTVLLLQGRAEFIEKYFETARDLGARGFTTATLDFRGQGRSDRLVRNRRKGHIRSFEQYRLDTEQFMREVVLPDCPGPYYLLGHSTGGAVALALANSRPIWFERAVITAPLLGIPLGKSQRRARMLAATLAGMGFGRAFIPGGRSRVLHLLPFAGNRLTSDPVRYERTAALLRAAPDLAVGSPTIGWVHAAFRATRALTDPNFVSQLSVPVLAVMAGDERLVDNNAIEEFGRNLRAGGVVTIPNARHELLMERDKFRDLFWAAFDAFIPGSVALAA
jgi:lysophospholipase